MENIICNTYMKKTQGYPEPKRHGYTQKNAGMRTQPQRDFN
jgi:hypothetical protein